MHELLSEYKDGKKQLDKLLKALDKEDPGQKDDCRLVGSMMREMDFSIEWMETGFMPEKESRIVLCEPDWFGCLSPYIEVEERIDRERAEKPLRKKKRERIE